MNPYIRRQRDTIVRQIIPASVRAKELFLSYLSCVSYATIIVPFLPIGLTAIFSAVAPASAAQHLEFNKLEIYRGCQDLINPRF
jgi:hypothetical protein